MTTGPGAAGRVATARHLARRFIGSLPPGGPPAPDEEWATGLLGPGELRLWRSMSGPDRRHAVAVARRVLADLGPVRAGRPVLAAALLHDVGKVAAGLGTFGRAAATAVGLAGGRGRAAEWARRAGPIGRVGRYLRHAPIGAALLEAAGSDPLTVAWAAEHHLPPSRWQLPAPVAAALKAADDD